MIASRTKEAPHKKLRVPLIILGIISLKYEVLEGASGSRGSTGGSAVRLDAGLHSFHIVAWLWWRAAHEDELILRPISA